MRMSSYGLLLARAGVFVAVVELAPELGARAVAQLSPAGVQFQANSYTTSDQNESGVAADSQGNFVIVWESYGSSGTDTDSTSIQAQRYATDGSPRGAEFQVNAYTSNGQLQPAVSSDSQGDFVAVWVSIGSSGTDTDGTSIQAQRFAANGSPSGAQFQVNTYTTGTQLVPAVASDAAGDFVVVWASTDGAGTDTDSYSIHARQFDASGTPLGPQFQVNNYTTNAQFHPAVAADSSGNFVVAWMSNGSGDTDTDGYSVQARRFDSSGAPLGGQFQVNTYTTSHQKAPSVAADANGRFVVAWHSNGSAGTDTSSDSIHGQRYAANGSALGGNFQVNTYTTNGQRYAAVSSDAQGDFVIVWQSDGSAGADTSQWSVHGQRYLADGSARGGNFEVNTYTTGYQVHPALSLDALGDFVIAWESAGSSGTDTSSLSVQGQRYDGLFRDGFETDDTSRWSAVVP